MAMHVNMNNLINGKDSRWLQLEVCREFQRNKCSRPDTECKFAHPPANVEVQNGRVTACYDSIKGRCNREKPPCKYFHPPQHLKDQLLINGRNHLALKNALMQQMGISPGQPLVTGQVPAVAANPYLTGMPQVGSTYSPYFAPGPIMPTIMGPDPTVGSPLGVVPQTVVAQQKMPRSDRLEMDMKTVGSFYYDNFAFPGMMPYKRPAADKSGVPVYQPNATTYQQLMQLQQPFVPVSCEYSSSPTPTSATTSASPPMPADSSQIVPVSASQLPQITASKETVAEAVAARPASTPAPAAAPPQSAAIPDPAALAKEVAQQNYAKALKQAAVNQSLVASQLNQLNPLNYTGVALNKQAMAFPPPTFARYPAALPVGLGATTGLNFGLGNPYAASAMAQSGFLARPATTVFNPYSLIRAPTGAPSYPQSYFSHAGLLGAQYPATVATAAPLTTVTVTPAGNLAAAAAAAQNNNNNNVAMPPLKKLKTT